MALEVKWADPTPVESAPGTPTPMETQADPTTPRAVVPPPAMPKPRAPARDADVPMGPADPLPKAAGAPKKAAPAVKPLEQRKKPIWPFQPPPINLQTKPKPSYAKATARSPAKPGPIRPAMVKGKVYVKDPNSGVQPMLL